MNIEGPLGLGLGFLTFFRVLAACFSFALLINEARELIPFY
jgi:hypothetical protein